MNYYTTDYTSPEISAIENDLLPTVFAPPSHAFPIDCLGEVMMNAALAMHRVIKAPLPMCAQSILAGANLAAQRLFDVCINGRRYPLSLYLLTIALMNERKTECDKVVMVPVDAAERQLRLAYKQNCDSERGLLVPPSLKVTDATIQGLLQLYVDGCSALAWCNDEGGTFFGGWSLQDENKAHSLATLSGLWSGRPVTKARRGDSKKTKLNILANRRLCMHLLLQPIIALPVLSNQLMREQGFLSRFLIAWPESTQGFRKYNSENLCASEAIQCYHKRITQLLNCVPYVDPELVGELNPQLLIVDGEALTLWIDAYNQIETQLKPGGQLIAVRGLAGKAAEQCLRIAGTLAVFLSDQPEITLQIMQSAIELTQWYLNEGLRIVGLSASEADRIDAETLLLWLLEHYVDQAFTTKEVYQRGPQYARSASKARGLLSVLESWGSVQRAGEEIWLLAEQKNT